MKKRSNKAKSLGLMILMILSVISAALFTSVKDVSAETIDISLVSDSVYTGTLYMEGHGFDIEITPASQVMLIERPDGTRDSITLISEGGNIFTGTWIYNGRQYPFSIDLPENTMAFEDVAEIQLMEMTIYDGTIYMDGHSYRVKIYPTLSEMQITYPDESITELAMDGNEAVWILEAVQYALTLDEDDAELRVEEIEEEDNRLIDNLIIEQVDLTRGYAYEPGERIQFRVNVRNNARIDAEDLVVSVAVYRLALYQEAEIDVLGAGESITLGRVRGPREFVLNIPENADPGQNYFATVILRGAEGGVYYQTNSPYFAVTPELDIKDTLRVGERKTYTVRGNDYEIYTRDIDADNGVVRFTMNGEMAENLHVRETYAFGDESRIWVSDMSNIIGQDIAGVNWVQFGFIAGLVERHEQGEIEEEEVPEEGEVIEVEEPVLEVVETEPTREPEIYIMPPLRYDFKQKLYKGWNLVSLPGKAVKFISNDLDSRRLLGFVQVNGDYLTLKQALNRLGKSKFSEHLSKHAFWVYSFSDQYLKAELKTKTRYSKLSLVNGWNMVPITYNMVGKSLNDIKTLCNIEKPYFWDSLEQKWERFSLNRAFTSSDVGKGFVVRSSNYCTFGEPSLTPPDMPGDEDETSSSRLPDLIVSKLKVSKDSDEWVKIDYCIKNNGKATPGWFSLQFKNLNNPDRSFGKLGFSGESFAPGKKFCSSSRRSGVGYEGGNGYISGSNEIQAEVDSEQEVVESNEGNNYKFYTFNTHTAFDGPEEGLPDLTISSLTVSKRSDGQVEIRYCIKNLGSDLSGDGYYLKMYNLDNPSWGFGGAGFSGNNPHSGEEMCFRGSRTGVGYSGGNGYVAGENKIKVVVDAYNQVHESNENNNYMVYAFDTHEAFDEPVEEEEEEEQEVYESGNIAYWWGKVNKYKPTGEGWRNDPDGSSGASIDYLTYCRKWFPDTVSAGYTGSERINDWKNAGLTGSYSATTPVYECLDRQIADSECGSFMERSAVRRTVSIAGTDYAVSATSVQRTRAHSAPRVSFMVDGEHVGTIDLNEEIQTDAGTIRLNNVYYTDAGTKICYDFS